MDTSRVSFKSSRLQGADLPTFISMWLSDHELQYAQSTHDSYRQAMDQFLAYWGKRQKPPMDSLLVKQYARDLKWRHRSAAYLQRQLSVLRSFCGWAVDQNLLPSNPTTKTPLPKLSSEYCREALDETEAIRLLASIPVKNLFGLRDLLLVSLILRAGTRLIELNRANVGDFVRKEKVGLLYLQGKGREANDSFVVLVPDLADLMEKYLSLRGSPRPGSALFISNKRSCKGGRLSVRGIQNIITGYLKKAGLKRARVVAYSLRHAAATIALQNGADLKAVQDMMRHASISTTQKYVHLNRRIEDGAEHRIPVRMKVELSSLGL